MLYSLFKSYARFALKVYCRRVLVNKPELLQSKGPLLLAANHPNSFLDGIILTTLFEEPVYSLARGDAFKNSLVNRLLRAIRLLPVYRTTEGVENLEHNYTTFNACQEAFGKGGIVLIFSEGLCENEWRLRPLKKGTARLAVYSWQKDIPLRVVPVGFNYSSFKKFGKELHLWFGETITAEDITGEKAEGKQLLAFNEKLSAQLQGLVYEIDGQDKATRKKVFEIRPSLFTYFLLLPAAAGALLHAPLFVPCKLFATIRFGKSSHYDSVLTTLLVLAYPIYVLVLFLAALPLGSKWAFLLLLLLPFTSWAAVRVKYAFDW